MYAIRSYYDSDARRTCIADLAELVGVVERRQNLFANSLCRIAGLVRIFRITSYNVCYTKLLRGTTTKPHSTAECALFEGAGFPGFPFAQSGET